jgi:hypothetical protein
LEARSVGGLPSDSDDLPPGSEVESDDPDLLRGLALIRKFQRIEVKRKIRAIARAFDSAVDPTSDDEELLNELDSTL